MNKFDYVCDGQMTMFEFLQEEHKKPNTLGDLNIDMLVKFIQEEMEISLKGFPSVKSVKIEYDVWSHIPNLGKRLSIFYHFNCEYNTMPRFYCGIGVDKIAELIPIEKLKQKAHGYGLELSLMNGPNDLFFSTIELKKAKTIKKPRDKEEYEDE